MRAYDPRRLMRSAPPHSDAARLSPHGKRKRRPTTAEGRANRVRALTAWWLPMEKAELARRRTEGQA